VGASATGIQPGISGDRGVPVDEQFTVHGEIFVEGLEVKLAREPARSQRELSSAVNAILREQGLDGSVPFRSDGFASAGDVCRAVQCKFEELRGVVDSSRQL